MRIAIVWNQTYPLIKTTVRHDLYVRGFQELGHEVITVCLQQAAAAFPSTVLTFESVEDPAKKAFWEEIGADVVLMVTWLVKSAEFEAARSAGARTIAIADSDGQVGFNAHWRHVLYRSVLQHSTIRHRLAALKYFGQRMLARKRESATIIRSVEASDTIFVNTSIAAKNVSQFLNNEHRHDLAARIGVCPYPVDPAFTHSSVNPSREPLIVAVGRWDSEQKDGVLLAAALTKYCRSGGRCKILIFGASCEALDRVQKRFSNVSCQGAQSPNLIANAMARARSLVLTSRWESGPIVAFEALCSGCTLISTDIPNMRELVGEGEFGTLAVSRSADAMADAISKEMTFWDGGARNATRIAAQWQPAFRVSLVCEVLLRAAGELPNSLLSDGHVTSQNRQGMAGIS